MFPDGSDAQDFGTTQSQGERLAAAGASPQDLATVAEMPMGPAGMVGTTSADLASDPRFGQLSTLAPSQTSESGRDTQQDEARRALLASASGTPAVAPASPKVTCPNCGKLAAYSHADSTCPNCGTKLKDQEGAVSEAPFTGNSFSLPTQLRPVSEVDAPTMALNLTADQTEAAELMLANYSAQQRREMAKKGEALPDGSYPIKTAADVSNAVRLHGNGNASNAKIKAHIIKRAKAIGATDKLPDDWKPGVNASQDPPEHNATIQTLHLEHTQGDKGLIWKVLCKTGTLALSPGPGQVDVEKPLNLTAAMFQEVKKAWDDQAFEHVTIPETHGNGTLENTGTVRHLAVLTKPEALADSRLSAASKASFSADSPDTLYMLGGMHFTDSKVRQKAEEGSILNCSVGLKFNYRRKRDGKLYPIALEHVALTNQPWVDGLGAFGGTDLSAPFDQEELPVWDGVFMAVPEAAPEPDAEFRPTEPSSEAIEIVRQRFVAQDGHTSSEASLSNSQLPGGISETMETASTTPTLEEILASQQATIERLEREARERDQQLSLSAEQQRNQGRELHLARTNARVSELQSLGVPSAVLVRYKNLALAAFEASNGGDGTLQLSVTQGDSTEMVALDPIAQAEYLLAAMPLGQPDDNVVSITRGVAAEALALSQEPGERKEASVSERADSIEQRIHPERFDAEGKRLPADKRAS